MNRALVQRLLTFLAVGVLVASASGAGQAGGDRLLTEKAFQDRLFGGSLRPIAEEEVSSVLEKHPDDAQLLYAASVYFEGERRQELLDKAISLDKKYEAVALVQELFRALPGGFAERERSPSAATLSRASEILAKLMVLDPENALPHWFLADQAFKQDKAEQGFAQIGEALKKRKFETYDSAHLRARFHLLDAMGRDGILKFAIQAGTVFPYLNIGRQMSERLIEQGKKRLSAGDRAGALEDFAAAERLADELLLARPLFKISELVPKMIKEKAAQARVELYEAEGDAASAAGARLQIRALNAYSAQMAATFEINIVWLGTFSLGGEIVGAGLVRRLSEDALQAELAKPTPFAGTLDTAAAQFGEFTTSPEFKSMMEVWFENLWEEGESVALKKAGEFYRTSSLAQKQERLMEAFGALLKAAEELPKDKDWVCVNNLKHIGGAILIYAKEHSGVLPESLEELVAGRYLEDPAMLKCSVSGTQYVYVGKGLKSDANPRVMIAYDDGPVHSGIRHALFVDGHVETMPEKVFAEGLRQQQRPEQPAPSATQ